MTTEERICKLERRTKIQSLVIGVGILLAVGMAAAPKLPDGEFDTIKVGK